MGYCKLSAKKRRRTCPFPLERNSSFAKLGSFHIIPLNPGALFLSTFIVARGFSGRRCTSSPRARNLAVTQTKRGRANRYARRNDVSFLVGILTNSLVLSRFSPEAFSTSYAGRLVRVRWMEERALFFSVIVLLT